MSTEEALIAAIDAHPDDRAGYAVYADWLLEQGDPLGEIMAAELRGVDMAPDFEAERRTYFQRHFPFLPLRANELATWKNGVFERLSFATHLGAETVKAIAETRAARCLRELHLNVTNPSRQNDEPRTTNPIPALLAYPVPRMLRKLNFHLVMRRLDGRDEPFVLTPLCPQLSRLEDLSIYPHVDGFGVLDLPSLRVLTTSLRSGAVMRELAQAQLPKLETLRFESAFWSLLASFDVPEAPNIQLLSLGGMFDTLQGPGFDAVLRSPLVKRVPRLEITGARHLDETRRGELERVLGSRVKLSL